MKNNKTSLSYRQVVSRYLPLEQSVTVIKQGITTYFNNKIRRSRITNFRDDSPLFYNDTKAFTLIELLVVVLIIGILAAVALPQYQKSVDKARMSNLVTMAKAVVDAQEVYYLANGNYTSKWEELSVSFAGQIKWGNTLALDNGIQLALRLKSSAGPDCVNATDSRLPGVQLFAGYPHTDYANWNLYWRCFAKEGNARANQLCKLVTHKKNKTSTSSENDVYYFPGMPY